MPPKLYLVRHAQGEHNATRDYTIHDPLLTATGMSQCRQLQSEFLHHAGIDLVVSSPLRRTIQTAAYSFGPVLARSDVRFILLPGLQEVSDLASDTGHPRQELEGVVADMFKSEDVEIELGKIDFGHVTEGWNDKTGYWAYTRDAISARAADMRNWLFQRPEEQIVIVTHGAFLHFLTEDVTGVKDAMLGTAYKNCEVRTFGFTPQSTDGDAHIVEIGGQKSQVASEAESAGGGEDDLHVVEEVRGVTG
ncbi:histidine phosphatase superfamily [Massariosphaeria phaeospora]|uniref:Histidine phosphatase superfamily n=1 Tax=Massariosphaeria phaeospora TaxID=100035 RepID=A0A7C8I9V0_9PLEO|nr:histidine phosphatase superfamily [Massariosphaeria phaeospora]